MAARIAGTVATALAALDALIYIIALITMFVAGLSDPIGASGLFGAQLLETQAPLLLLLGAVWVICVLADSLKIVVLGCATNILVSPRTTDLHRLILRIAERLHGLTSSRRIDILVLAAPASSFLASHTSPPSPLATSWSPSTHPNLAYG